MKTGEKLSGLAADLRAAANGALKRLAGASAPAPAAAPVDPTSDPTVGLFGDDDTGGEPVGNPWLSEQFSGSAEDMRRRNKELYDKATELAKTIALRVKTEAIFIGQILPLAIGFAWLALGLWLGGLSDEAANLQNAEAANDLNTLSSIFFRIGMIGAFGAFAYAVFLWILGIVREARVREAGAILGQSIADTANEFKTRLDALRNNMDQRTTAPERAVDDLSRAYATALEAYVYFLGIGFMTEENTKAARKDFEKFLKRPSQAPSAVAALIVGLLLGLLFGASYVYVKYVPKPEDAVPLAALTPLAKYPTVFALLLATVAAYLLVELAAATLWAFAAGGARKKAHREALDALRSAFTAREAPRPADIAQRIQDAVDVFTARVGGRRVGAGAAQANHSGGSGREFTGESDDAPHWRRRDSSVKLVETEFSAAPARWRTDAYAKKLSGGPEAKRDLQGGKKRRGD